MICSTCGAPREKTDAYCGRCGVRFGHSSRASRAEWHAGVSAVALLIVVGAVAILWQRWQATPDQPAAGLLSDAALRERVLSAIQAADEAEIDAHRTGDLTPIYRVYAGDALKGVVDSIQAFRSSGRWVEERLVQRAVQDVTFTRDRSRV